MAEDANAVNDQVVADTTSAESAPVEKESTANVPEDVDLENIKDIPLDPSQRQETESEVTDTQVPVDKAEETQTETQSQTGEKPLSPKSENRFQQLANDNRELREEIERLRAQEAQFAQEQGLLDEVNPDTGENYTPQEAERLAFLQSRENQAQQISQQRYVLEVQQVQQSITDEANKVGEEYPELIDPKNENYDPEIAAEYDAILGQNLIYEISDGQGNSYRYPAATLVANGINPATQATLVGSNVSPLQIAKLTAESARKAASKAATIGQAKAQKATEKMLANADTAPGVASNGSGDDLDALFDKIKDVQLS